MYTTNVDRQMLIQFLVCCDIQFINPQHACARGLHTVVTFLFWRRRLFRVETYISTILGDDLAFKLENRSYFGEKASGTSATTAVFYTGIVQSLNSLARELLARELLARERLAFSAWNPLPCHSLCIVLQACRDCFPFRQRVR